MGKLRDMVGAGALVVGLVLAWSGIAAAEVVDYTPTVQVEGATQVRSPAPAGPETAATGQLPYTGTQSSLPLAEIGAGLLAVGGVAVVAVRSRRPA